MSVRLLHSGRRARFHVGRFSCRRTCPVSVRFFGERGTEKDYIKNVESEEEPPIPTIADIEKYTKEIPVRMPDMGEGKGKVLKWFKKEGDVVQREDIICDIQTPDFTFGLEVDDSGLAVMGKILVDAPSEPIDDDEVICYLLHKEKEGKEE